MAKKSTLGKPPSATRRRKAEADGGGWFQYFVLFLLAPLSLLACAASGWYLFTGQTPLSVIDALTRTPRVEMAMPQPVRIGADGEDNGLFSFPSEPIIGAPHPAPEQEPQEEPDGGEPPPSEETGAIAPPPVPQAPQIATIPPPPPLPAADIPKTPGGEPRRSPLSSKCPTGRI